MLYKMHIAIFVVVGVYFNTAYVNANHRAVMVMTTGILYSSQTHNS